MTVFFNGRLWTTPVVASAVNDSALANSSLSEGQTLVILGPSQGGQPQVPLVFGSASEAAATLLGGDLLDAVTNAFSPSNDTGGPTSITAMRVQTPAAAPAGITPGTCSQSSLMLTDSAGNNVILLTSADWGAWTNNIYVRIFAGTTQGVKARIIINNAYTLFTQDNIYDAPFIVTYAGTATTATIAISNTSVTLVTGTVTTVLNLVDYPTIELLTIAISTVSGWGTSLTSTSEGLEPTLNALDTMAATSAIGVTITVTATLQALVNWFNSEFAGGVLTAVRQPGAGTLPYFSTVRLALTGGNDGTTTLTDYSNAYTALQQYDCQFVVPASNSLAVISANDTHCQYMSTTAEMERRGFCGMPLGTTDAAAIAEAYILNSDRTALNHIGVYLYNSAGVLTLYQPFIAAAMIGGIFAAVSPGTPATNKSMNIKGLERIIVNPSGTDPLIDGGILTYTKTRTGFRIVQSITTWLTNNNFDKVEVSTGVAVDYMMRAVRDAARSVQGTKGNPVNLAQAVQNVHTALVNLAVSEPQGPGVLAGDANNPPFLGLTGTQNGDVISIQFQASPVIPNNYILITVYATPFSGSVSVGN